MNEKQEDGNMDVDDEDIPEIDLSNMHLGTPPGKIQKSHTKAIKTGVEKLKSIFSNNSSVATNLVSSPVRVSES